MPKKSTPIKPLSLFDNTGKYTPEGMILIKQLLSKLGPIYKKYTDKGYNSVEIQYIMICQATILEFMCKLK